jgi:hypothetical protein
MGGSKKLDATKTMLAPCIVFFLAPLSLGPATSSSLFILLLYSFFLHCPVFEKAKTKGRSYGHASL